MPELPEVETIRMGLNEQIVGLKIVGFWTDSPKQVQPSPEMVEKAILGTTIKKIDRRAKILFLYLNNGTILAVHLKLTGRLLVRKASEPKDEWQHITIKLKKKIEKSKKDEDLELRFCDARKFGWMKLIKNSELRIAKEFDNFGPEPLKDLTLKKFQEILQKNNRPIKIILMDQTKIAGVGNIYANDALFLAKIDPKKKASQLNKKESVLLFKALEKVLRLGVKYGGASDQYYLNAYGKKGFYQEHFLVYGKQGQKCPKNCGGLIKRIVVGGRGTFWCPACQR